MDKDDMFGEGWNLEEYLGFMGTMMLEDKDGQPGYFGLMLVYDKNMDDWHASYGHDYIATGKTVRDAMEKLWQKCLGHIYTLT